MKLVIGIGNPEDKFRNTRHNVGWHMLDVYAKEKGVDFQAKDKFKALIAEVSVEGEKVLLVKPTTYYNLSGEAGRAIADFYKVSPEDILIIHDELALPFGTVRTRLGGSDAGNNGVKSLNQHLGPNTARIRIGVYNELRDSIDDADFVLGKFTGDEVASLGDLSTKIIAIIDSFAANNFHVTSHR